MKNRTDRFKADPVIVIGSGIAGLLLSIELADEGCNVVLVTKGRLEESNTAWAQGGLAAVTGLNAADSKEQHLADTIAAGVGLTDPVVAERITAHGAKLVNRLAHHGVQFDPASLALEGGHRLARVLHSADATGRAIVDALISAAKKRSQIRVIENCLLREILIQNNRACGIVASVTTCSDVSSKQATTCADISGKQATTCADISGKQVTTGGDVSAKQVTIGNQVRGMRNAVSNQSVKAIGNDVAGQDLVIEGRAVVLATGGLGQVFSRTTNPLTATGDGIAAAYRAGAHLVDLEFVQFHPTALHLPGAPAFLISEAARGAGAILLNKNGERFMHKYHPAGELATRDIVSRAIFTNMHEEKTDCAWLDMRPIGEAKLNEQFPNIVAKLKTFGIDPLAEPVPVSPAAHYFMGGILADENGRTTLSGLFAIGECASTGLHGANRLASNSLLEGGVMALKLATVLANPFDVDLKKPLVVQKIPNRNVLAVDTSVNITMLPPNVFADSDFEWSNAQELAATSGFRVEEREQERFCDANRDLNFECESERGLGRESIRRESECESRRQSERESERESRRESFRRDLFEAAGLVRSENSLKTLISLYEESPDTLLGLLIAKSALLRKESRGAHWRSDYPKKDDKTFGARLVIGKDGAQWIPLTNPPTLAATPASTARL